MYSSYSRPLLEVWVNHNKHIILIISHTSPMDPLAPNAIASGRTKGGKPVYICGRRRRERPAKKNSYTRNGRLACGGTWLATAVFFQAPGLPAFASNPFRVLVAPAMATASPPLAAATASTAANDNVGSDNAVVT